MRQNETEWNRMKLLVKLGLNLLWGCCKASRTDPRPYADQICQAHTVHLKCGGCVGCVGCVSLFPPLVEDLKLCPGNGLNVVYDGPSKRQLHPKKMTHGRLGRRDSLGVKAVLLKRCIANCSHAQSQSSEFWWRLQRCKSKMMPRTPKWSKDFVFCISSFVFCRTNFEARIHDHNVRWAKFIEFKKDSLFGRLRPTCAVHIFQNFCKLHQNSRWNLAGVSCLTENHVPCDWLCLESLDTANKIHKTLNMHVYDSCCVIVYCMNRLYKWTVTAS